jgi:hypothetical protein
MTQAGPVLSLAWDVPLIQGKINVVLTHVMAPIGNYIMIVYLQAPVGWPVSPHVLKDYLLTK